MRKMDELHEESDLVMKALIVYDNFAFAAKATTTLQRVGLRVNVRVTWIIKPWQVNILRERAPAQNALFDAADAHLVVFAGPRAESTPSWIRDWLEQWASIRQIEGAAIAVIGVGFGTGFAESAPADLSQFVQQHGIDFVTGFATLPIQSARLPVLSSCEPQTALPVGRLSMAESAAGWQHDGIND